jgi:recombinational DNA repair ATPase RecF
MRLAEVERFSQGRTPAVLLDDAVQELDPGRRARFWELLPPEAQWFITGTVRPDVPVRDGFVEWSNSGGLWCQH